MSDLKQMPVVTVEQVIRFRSAAIDRIASLEALLKEREWIKCEDMMPEAGDWYMTFTDGQIEILFYDGENEHGIHWLQDGDWNFPVIQWMKLPSIPQEQDNAD